MKLNQSIAIVCSIAAMISISACGSKRSPTGGALDTEKPSVLASSPAEYAQIGKGVLEISFSKEMDRSSLANSIYIYPPVMNKKISFDGPTLKIKLNEELKQDTNYFVTLSTRLKDSRGNPLNRNQTLIFRNGELNNYRIGGQITYERDEDMGMPVEVSLLSADSLLVLSDRFKGSSFAIESLNPQAHILSAYIDKNLNGRYDFGLDPYYEGKSEAIPSYNMNISLAYADSTKPKLSRVQPVNRREFKLIFSEPIKSFESISFGGAKDMGLVYKQLDDNMLSVVCAPMDSTEHLIRIKQLEDLKGNITDVTEMKFRNLAPIDTIAPFVSYSNPRNGASVNSLIPVIELHFSEFVVKDKIQVSLSSGSEQIALKLISSTGNIFRYQPSKALQNYKSHILTVSKSVDFSGNIMTSPYELQFLPLKRD